MTDPALDDLELDALTELVNLGVSQAAFNLREMVGHQVILSVPSVAVLDRKSAIETLSKSEPQQARRRAPGFRGRHQRPRAAHISRNAKS